MGILNLKDSAIMVGGNNGIVSSFDISTHELIDIWNIGHPISSLACLTLDEKTFVAAVGTENGKIVLRQEWDNTAPRS